MDTVRKRVANAVADPGIPVGGGVHPRRGRFSYVCENKRIGSRTGGGGRVPGTPPRSANAMFDLHSSRSRNLSGGAMTHETCGVSHVICIYRLVMISIERSKTAQKSTLEIQDKFSLRIFS